MPHAVQASPPVPQALLLVPLRQTPLWQQPPGQVLGSHGAVHAWPTQLVEHCEQARPPVPQLPALVPARHTPPWQQPLGQVAGPQVPSHRSASQDPAPQPTQAMPAVPQARLPPPTRHEAPEQQPVGQLLALQVEVAQLPPVQAVPPQSRQALPPVPHAEGSAPVTHRPAAQQPAHEAAVHWQVRCRHSRPGSQAPPRPHWHWPLTQWSAPVASEQGGPDPHAQRPSAPHESAVAGSQVVHWPPAVPQSETLGDRHTPAAVQQPVQLSQPDIGSARMTVTAVSSPLTTPTCARPWATTAPPPRPSTKISRVCWSSASASNTRTDEVLGNAAPALSGRELGPNTAADISVPV